MLIFYMLKIGVSCLKMSHLERGASKYNWGGCWKIGSRRSTRYFLGFRPFEYSTFIWKLAPKKKRIRSKERILSKASCNFCCTSPGLKCHARLPQVTMEPQRYHGSEIPKHASHFPAPKLCCQFQSHFEYLPGCNSHSVSFSPAFFFNKPYK